MSLNLPTIHTDAPSLFELRFQEVRKRIDAAAKKEGRSPLLIRLVGSTRDLMVDPVLDAARGGLKEFNEEFIAEGVTKKPTIDRTVSGLKWHFSGTLQSKNMPLAVEFFDVLHGFDRLTLIRPLQEALSKKKRKNLEIFIEVNPLGTMKRTGVSVQELPALIESLLKIKEIRLKGLSFKSEPALSLLDRRHAYQEISKLVHQLPRESRELSLGTSADFETAIACGSTLLRIGSLLFAGKPTR